MATFSIEERDLVTRVGPGTQMGEFMRRHWIPVCVSEEVAEPDGAPIALRILGEDLVAFRATDGRVGVMDEHCPHRRASLTLARNEDNGIRCLYHGWKMTVDGTVCDTPCEPPSSQFKRRVSFKAYPTREAAGMVWAYMGPADTIPSFPNFNWLSLPSSHLSVAKLKMHCSYVHGVEGLFDPLHTNMLHRGYSILGWSQVRLAELGIFSVKADDTAVLGYEDQQYGFRGTSSRVTNVQALRRYFGDDVDPGLVDDYRYVRTNEFAFPFFAMQAPTAGWSSRPFIYVPADDVTTIMYEVVAGEGGVAGDDPILYFATNDPVDHEEHLRISRMRPGIDLNADYSHRLGKHNRYEQDRAMMAAREHVNCFSGIDSGILVQDLAMVEGMEPVSDWSRENLCASDTMIIALRRRLISAVQEFQQTGEAFASREDADWSQIRAVAGFMRVGEDWHDLPARIYERWQARDADRQSYQPA